MSCADGFHADGQVRLAGGHMGGQLVLSGGTFHNPDGDAIGADGLQVEQGMFCRDGFEADGQVRLLGARIGGQLDLSGGTFKNPNRTAVFGDGLQVRGDILCRQGFRADGQVWLLGARIGGQVDLSGGTFCNPSGNAISADGSQMERDLRCGNGFRAEGQVRLLNACVQGQVELSGKFCNPEDTAIVADRLQAAGDVICLPGFRADGQVRLIDAHIGRNLSLSGGAFKNRGGEALVADRLRVAQDMICRKPFHSDGRVQLLGAHIGGQLDCSGGQFKGSDIALDLESAVIDAVLVWQPAPTSAGGIDLRDARVQALQDSVAGWPASYVLNGFTYDRLVGAGQTQSVTQRLAWLNSSSGGYSPEVFDQLAAVYRANGDDDAARTVLVEKQRARARDRRHSPRVTEGWATSRLQRAWGAAQAGWDWFVRATVGYGYRPLRIVPWLLGLLAVGTVLFAELHPSDIRSRESGPAQPDFHPTLYALDLLLPVASLRQRDALVTDGLATGLAAGYTLTGWLLSAILVAGLSGLFRRD